MTKKLLMAALLALFTLLATGLCMGDETVAIIMNGKPVVTDTPGQIINGRTMVPIRVISEALGAKVEWDSQNRTVVINTESQQKLLKLNGEQTTWPYWYENGVLYMEKRNTVQLVREFYNHPNYQPAYIDSLKTFNLNNRSEDIEPTKKGDYTLLPLNTLKKAGMINYDWDAAKGNLVFKTIGK